MILTGAGIETPLEVKVLPGFKTETRLSVVWSQLESRRWVSIDRGEAADVYEAEIEIAGRDSYVNDILTRIYHNAANLSDFELYITDTSSAEQIFGPSIDYSGNVLSTVVISKGVKRQTSLKGFVVPLRLRLYPPIYRRGTATLPDFSGAEIGHRITSEVITAHSFGYSGEPTFIKRESEQRELEFSVRLTDAQARDFKRFIETTRGSAFSLPGVGGVARLFGELSNAYDTVHLLAFSERCIGTGHSNGGAPDWEYTLTVAPENNVR